MPETPTTPDPIEPGEAFAADLKAAYRETIAVPASVDAAILDAARRAEPESLPIRRWLAPVGAIAAAAVVGLVIWQPFGDRPAAGPPVAGDVDGSRTVDIVDALAMAQMLAASPDDVSIDWDLTRDGVVDQADVDAIAMQAVALPDLLAMAEGGGQG